MDKVLKQLDVIKDIGKRLGDLAGARGTPDNATEDLKVKSESLLWAHNELRERFVAESLLLVGHRELIEQIRGIPDGEIRDLPDSPLVFVVLFMPETVIREKICDQMSRGWEGKPLAADKTPEWLKCKRFFGCCDTEDQSKRAVLFESILLREWLNNIGYLSAKQKLGVWLIQIFSAMKWDEAEPV